MSRLRPLITEREATWDPEPKRRRRLNLKTLGTPYVEWKAKIGAEDSADDQAALAALLDADLISMFMRDDGDLMISAEADEVEAFCSPTTLRSLLSVTLEGVLPLQPIALLTERSLDGGIIIGIRNQGPFTPRQLYQAWKGARFREGDEHRLDETEEVSNARQRETIITDLDRWSICGIFGSAPRHQKTAMRSLVSRHLRFLPWVHVDTPSDNTTFQLTFGLPYLAMRDSDLPRNDVRRFKDGRPLRRCQDVSFLNLRSNCVGTYCYEGQISCLIVGKEDSTWDLIRFDDTYFENVPGQQRLVDIYHENFQAADGTQFAIDPSASGMTVSETTILDPRQKFLSVFQNALEHVATELERSVTRVHDAVRDYEHAQQNSQTFSKTRHSSQKTQDLSTIVKAKKFSTTLLKQLSLEFEVVETFFINRNALFKTSLCAPLVDTITRILEGLEYQKRILEAEVNYCKTIIDDQQSRLNEESNEAGRKNDLVSKFIIPVLLAAGIFSTQEPVLPFKANTKAFICVVLVFFGIIHMLCNLARYMRIVLNVVAKIGLRGPLPIAGFDFRKFLRKQPANSRPPDEGAEFSARELPMEGA